MSPERGGYLVFQLVSEDLWRIVGDVDRQPGLTAKKARAQAVRDVLGREPEEREVHAVLPRSEWRLSLDH